MELSREVVGRSPEIDAIRSRIAALVSRLAGSTALPSILIEGETGTGKGLLARIIHRVSPRRSGPFIDVNCAAIPPALVESEMFGFEQGAFTDAKRAKEGLFQSARGGTIFLDELALLPEGAQSKLLKVLEERTVRRLGSTRTEPLDVWVIAATNEDLRSAVRERRFREDLYHRLAVVTLALPPLRERGDDVVLLAEQFLTRACREYGLPTKTLGPDARAALLAYPWPGNVREVANAVERVALLSDSAVVTAASLALPVTTRAEPARATAPPAARPAARRDATDADPQREQLVDALEREGGNVSRAAVRLGLTRNAIRYRMEKYGLSGGPRVSAAPPESPAPAATPVAPASPSLAIRWERRRLAFLRVRVLESDEPAARVPSRVLQRIVDKIQSFGGRIEELSGTIGVGVFGLEPTEDAPRRAANAALAVQKALQRVQRDVPGPAVAVTACLHVSLGGVARVGDSAEIDAGVKRETWQVLDELDAGAVPGGVVVSAPAARFLERGFQLRPVETGSAGSSVLVAHERGGAAPEERGPTFVGRRRELETLFDAFEAAEAGRGQLVGLTGEAGIGKSRLLVELRRRLGDRPVTVVVGRCFSYTTAVPYFPMLDMLRDVLDVAEGDSIDSVQMKVRAQLDELHLNDEHSAQVILHLLGGSAEGIGGSPEALKARVFDVIRRLFAALSQRKPVLLIVEDMHWVDAISGELLASVAEIVPGARILLVETYRPGYRLAWLEQSYARQVALQPLSDLESRRLVESVSPHGSTDTSVTDLILTRGEGNPFFLEELTRALHDPEGASSGSVPETVHDVLLARIDRLATDDRLLLQTAAVIGRDVPRSLLQRVATAPESARTYSLARLRAGEFIHETTLGGEPAYTFRHAMIHDVAYDTVPEAQRASLHGLVAEAIEQLYPTRLGEHAGRLAEHALRGELWAKAVTYARQAGAKALAASSHRDALHWFEQAGSALARLPQTDETRGLAVDLHLDAGSALVPLGEFNRFLERLRAAERLAGALADRRRLGRVCAYLTGYFRQIGNYDEALQTGQRGLAAAEVEGDLGILVTTNIYLAHVYYDIGQYGRATAHLRRNIEVLGTDKLHERFGLPYVVSIHSHTWLAANLAELGRFTDAIEHAHEAMQIAESLNHTSSLVSAHMGLGRAYVRRGDMEHAVPVLERGVELARQLKMRFLLPFLIDALGLAYALSGRVTEGLPLLQEALDLHVTIRGTAFQSTRLVSLAQGHLLAGHAREAVALATRALELAGKHGERGQRAYAHAALAEASSALPSPDYATAERHWLEALMDAEELEMRPLVARGQLGLGALARRLGRADAAERLDRAIALLRELGMPLWLAQAEAERARLS